MCTLTYRLTEIGYELFFNRDEQHSRSQAHAPKMDKQLNALYPIDPLGKGTWIAVHQSGLSLALLNYYQAQKNRVSGKFKSRGEIILKLLEKAPNVITVLKTMPLHIYQPFQLCLFPSDLTLSNQKPRYFQWDGIHLTESEKTLPITSSGVDYPQVYQARKITFKQMVDANNPTSKQLLNYHQSQQQEGKLSVKMSRSDAQTVSLSCICVSETVEFRYIDYLDKQRYLVSFHTNFTN
ncbi:NRDE family protein [Psychromonas hadalis]|uniref:NRDE family protein n=1 Tax=Psychromonas hadalis TaxID=211669 RepID=UPI0003B5BE9D|nr:NRDE family protein [Psychromonas hadalis]